MFLYWGETQKEKKRKEKNNGKLQATNKKNEN